MSDWVDIAYQILAMLAIIAGLVLIVTMLLGIYHVGPLTGWWQHR